jgi:hypothetical protein
MKIMPVKTKGEEIPFRFKVSGNIIRKLGEESITNKNVAILELIKNSYDAGAAKVEISLKHEELPEHATIIISDNGMGMTAEDLENKWMNLATANKTKIKLKKGSRIPVGEKGLGRLSSESLGRKTLLETKPIDERKAYKIFFNWEEYQKENILCNEVINKGFSTPKKKKEKGTSIEITELKHDWSDAESQKSLLRDIYLLHPINKVPKDFRVDPTFHKYIKDFKKIRSEFLKKAIYSLKTRLVGGNRIRYEFKTIRGKKKTGTVPLDRKLSCGDATLELFFYYRDINALKRATGLTMTPIERTHVRDILTDYQGIKLYRDNFRVKPYGERGNDWIGLEITAQNNTMCPRNNTIFGMVHVGRVKNPQIKDTTTREGVIANEEFEDLRDFVRTSIVDLFVDLRSEEESHKKKARKDSKMKRIKEVVGQKKKQLIIVESPKFPPEEQNLLEIMGDYPQNFYEQLEREINECYNEGYLNATFVLSRKIIESLIYEILEKKFPGKEDLWWNSGIGYPLNLSPLMKNLHENRRGFGGNIKRIIERFDSLAGDFRDEVNKIAHNIYDYIDKKEEIKRFKISELIQLLVKIYSLL